ncbi:MAG: hypothetical protein Q9218_003042 [Villophora microphyllina]
MPNEKPNPQQLTLRFKQHKTTVLLLVSPNDTFDSIKEKLLSTLKATGVTQINGHSLPVTSGDVVFGVPIDKNDPDQGWVRLIIPANEEDGAKKGKTKDGVLNKTPQGAGLKDGSVVAFKFQENEKDDDDLAVDDREWDVVMPAFEDEADPQ